MVGLGRARGLSFCRERKHRSSRRAVPHSQPGKRSTPSPQTTPLLGQGSRIWGPIPVGQTRGRHSLGSGPGLWLLQPLQRDTCGQGRQGEGRAFGCSDGAVALGGRAHSRCIISTQGLPRHPAPLSPATSPRDSRWPQAQHPRHLEAWPQQANSGGQQNTLFPLML